MTESGRDALRMSEEEVWTFLSQGRRVQVCTNGADGWPHVVPLSYFVDNRALMAWTDGDSRKVANLRLDDRVSCLVEQGEGIGDFRAVQIRGRAELVEDYEASRRVGTTLFERYAGGPLDATGLDYVAALAHLRVGIRIRPAHIVSWDHRKVQVDVRTIGS
jgi:PPOX class probable F420-dependent enzyme